MSLCQPYTGVPSRLRSHLQRCSHSQGIMIPDAVPLKKRKSHPGSPGTEAGPSGTHSTPVKAGGRGKLSDEQQGEFNVHLWHIFNMLDIPIETLTNPTFVQFFSKYIPQATLPSRSLFYTLSASRNIAPPNLSSAAATVGPTGSPDFQGLARLAAGFASVPGVSGVSELSGVQGSLAYLITSNQMENTNQIYLTTLKCSQYRGRPTYRACQGCQGTRSQTVEKASYLINETGNWCYFT